MRGRVLQLSGLHALVDAKGEAWQCELRGRLKAGGRVATAPLAVGDWVEVRAAGQKAGVVEEVYPRQGKLSRLASGKGGREQVIAANVDQLVVVVAARQPETRPGFIDRAIAMALAGQIQPVLCINKVDLGAPEQNLGLGKVYVELGYRVCLTSALTGAGLAELAELLAGKVSAMVGPSGVGKSSLLNLQAPGLNARTGALMRRHDRGRHTTTTARLYPLPQGGYVVDTPGIKELQLWQVDRRELVDHFVEMAPLAGGCQFRDCRHLSEPGCAIREAVAQGRISALRYEGYLRIAASLEDGI
ncbi:MAG: ribosome small subunit-dependent GTPase A [Candidatus Handelsmanbacteria bacterium]|nr:ribosome small subunit-dependent GTPase A [Candidatus Handelsmanbacteria bacterium]